MNSLYKSILRAFATLARVCTDGDCSPHSAIPIVERAIPDNSAKFSCEIHFLFFQHYSRTATLFA